MVVTWPQGRGCRMKALAWEDEGKFWYRRGCCTRWQCLSTWSVCVLGNVHTARSRWHVGFFLEWGKLFYGNRYISLSKIKNHLEVAFIYLHMWRSEDSLLELTLHPAHRAQVISDLETSTFSNWTISLAHELCIIKWNLECYFPFCCCCLLFLKQSLSA